MRLVAIFIPPRVLRYVFGENHQGQTLNLGGKNFYNFGIQNGGPKLLSQKPNPCYVENFWGNNLCLVSAIVGANGAGKSSILNVFRFKSNCFYIYEHKNKTGYKVVSETSDINDIIYYSPFLNIENHNFVNSNFKDISKYELMLEDSEFESLELSAQLELHNSENLKRWIKFRLKENIESFLKDILLPVFDKIIVKINYVIPQVHDTPYRFRPFFERFAKIKEDEEGSRIEELLVQNPKYNRENLPRFFGNRIRLELEMIIRVINKIQNILESSGNKYLNAGFINNNFDVNHPEFTKIKSLKMAFFLFIDNAYIIASKDNKVFFPVEEIKNLIELLVSFVPKNDDEITNFTEFSVSFENGLDILSGYEKFIISFKEHFSLDRKILLTFRPNKNLSSGEKGMYDLLASLYDYQFKVDQNILEEYNRYSTREKHNNNYIILLDEADLGFHPHWKRRFINSILELFSVIFPKKKLQIIFTTHDPLTLSDIPNKNIVYLNKKENNETYILLNHEQRSFGANVHDLLAHSFFLKDGLMGEFAKKKIQEVLNNLNSQILEKEIKELKNSTKPINTDLLKSKELQYKNLKGKFVLRKSQYLKSIIEITDEPILKYKMEEMFYEAFPNEIDKRAAISKVKNILGNAGLDLKDLIDDIS